MAMDQIILFAALGIVAGILGWGVLTMARGGEYNIKTVSYTHLTLPTIYSV